MKTIIKTTGAVGILTLAVAGTSATAAPLLELGYSQHAGFDTPTFFNGSLQFKAGSEVPNADPLAPAGTSTKFAWEGDNAPVESSISIASFNNSTAPTADLDATPLRLLNDFSGPDLNGEWNVGDWWVITTLTQTNNVLNSIPGGAVTNPLWNVDALANLRIYDDATRANLLYADPTTATNISFNETVNQGTCPGPNPLGTSCDDVFTVLTASFAPVNFVHDGFIYSLNFTLLPGTSTSGNPPVNAGSSLVVDNGDGTISVWTPENNPGTSSIHVAMSYSVVPVPSPSVLGLMGAGVLALGFAGRRRRKAQS